MKKIINGKMYNTDTAKEVATRNEFYGYNDFRSYIETLYKKKTGEFFLYGCGGGLTAWAKVTPFGREWGENIIPLTSDEVKEWCEKNIDTDEYEKILGPVEE